MHELVIINLVRRIILAHIYKPASNIQKKILHVFPLSWEAELSKNIDPFLARREALICCSSYFVCIQAPKMYILINVSFWLFYVLKHSFKSDMHKGAGKLHSNWAHPVSEEHDQVSYVFKKEKTQQLTWFPLPTLLLWQTCTFLWQLPTR